MDNTRLVGVANEFVGGVNSGKQTFGQFPNRDLSLKIDLSHKGTQA